MSQTVYLLNGQPVEFPADAKPDEINRILGKMYPKEGARYRFLPSRGIAMEIPNDATPQEEAALQQHFYPRTGADVAFDLQDPKFGMKISLDDYKLYRGFLAENKKSVGEMVSEGASMVLGDLWEGAKAQAKDQTENPITGPLRTAHDMAVAFGVGTHDLIDMGIRGFEKPYANDTYEEFLKGDISWTNPQQNLRRGMRWLQTGKMSRKDSPKARETYEKLLKKDLENFRDQSDREAFRARLLSKAFAEKRAHAGSYLLDPSIIVPIPGTKALTTAARVGAKATGKAVETTGRALARTGAAVSGTADDLATAGGKAFEATVGMTPDMAQTTARAVGVGVPVASGLGTPLAVGYGLTKAAQYGGEVLAEAGQGMQRGLGRGGLFGSAAHRMEMAGLEGTPQYRAARLLSLADTPLEAAAHVSGGALTGALIGGGLGMWAGGEEGFWHGLGAGGALGAGGGGIGYGIGKATGALSAEARKADNDYRLSQLPEADRARLESYRKWQGDDQLAVILDTKDFLEGGLKDGRVIFYANPDGPRGSALSIADTDSGGMPAIKINLAKMDGAYTVGHELFHALSKVEQLQPKFQPILDAIGGRYDDTGTRLLQEGIIPQAALETFFNDYHRKELPLIRSKILAEAEALGLTEGTKEHGDHVVTELAKEEGKFNTAGKRAKYVAEEIGAEYMARLIAGAGPDAMLKGFDTHLRGKLDSILIQRSEGILSSLTQRFSDLGISPVESQLFPGLEKANPVLNAMMRDLLRARRELNERMEGTDTKSTSVIRKQDVKHYADELQRLGLVEQDANGNWKLRDNKDIERDENNSDSALREILEREDPNGFQVVKILDDDGKQIGEEIRGTRFSPDQVQAISEHSLILPTLKTAVAAFNEAVANGTLINTNYYAATRRSKSKITQKWRSVYSSGIKRTTRSLMPYTLEISKAGNIFVRALDYTKAVDMAAKMRGKKQLAPWDGSVKKFLKDFKKYLSNLSGEDPVRTRKKFGDAKAEVLHDFLQSGEKGGARFVHSFRLDRMDGIMQLPQKIEMSEQAWSLSKERFMPDDATVRQVVSGRMEHGTPLPAAVVLTPNIIERFLPAVDDPGYHSPEGKIAFPMLADRMKVGGYTSRSGRTHELRGGPDHPDIVDNKGVVAWAVEGGSVATQLQNAINKTDGIGLVVLQDEAAVAGNKTFMEIMLDELAFDVVNRKKTAVNNQIKKAVGALKKVKKPDGSTKFPVLGEVNIRNLDELAAAAPGFSFELRGELFKKIASIEYKRKHGGIFWRDVMRDVTDYQNKDGYRTGDIVKVIQFDQGESIVNPKDVGTPPHPAYKFAVLGHTVSNVKGRLSAFQVFRSAFDAMEAEKSGRGITPEGKVGKSAFRSMMTRWLSDTIFRQDVSGRALDVAARDEPLEFQAKSGPQRAELAQRSEINRELGARHLPDTGGQDALGMFSAAERAAVGLKQERGSASQMLSMIKKAGVKDEEIVELGLDKFLEGNRKVSKDEIVDHLVENQITVEETVLSGAGYDLTLDGNKIGEFPTYEAAETHMKKLVDDSLGENAIANDWADAFARYEIEESDASTKHASYVEPGAVEGSYRELLLRLPKQRDKPQRIARFDDATFYEMPDGRWVDNQNPDLVDMSFDSIDALRAEGAEFSTIESGQAVKAGQSSADTYTGGHYGEHPNVLAHIRFNERPGPNGERVLFLEEIQSDWHQEGRKKGYGTEPSYVIQFKIDNSYFPGPRFSNRADAERFLVQREADFSGMNKGKLKVAEEQVAAGRVPDAPFKTSWHELAMKRMIRYAADNGFDSIAWTQGETQAARYDLSKQVDEIRHQPNPNVEGRYSLVILKDGTDVVTESLATPERLEQLVGKEITQKIINGEGRETGRDFGREKSLSGLDLKVGGEGMKGFYDKMLPRMKTWKKLGLKVETHDFSDGLPEGWKLQGGPMPGGTTGYFLTRKRGEIVGPRFASPEEAVAWLARSEYGADVNPFPAHIVHLTPDVKAKVLESGLARFMPDTGLPGTERNQLGWAMLRGKNGKWKVYKPGGVLAGIGGSKQRAETIFRTHYKRELTRQTR